MLPNTAKVPQKWHQYLRLRLKKNSRTITLRSLKLASVKKGNEVSLKINQKSKAFKKITRLTQAYSQRSLLLIIM